MDELKLITLDDLKPGMIGFSCGYEWIQKAISVFTRRKAKELVPSHSFPIHMGPGGVLCAIETTIYKTHTVPIELKMSEPDWVEIWEPVCEAHEVERSAAYTFKKYADMIYGHLSYIWFVYRAIIRWIKKVELQVVWSWASKGVTCTELTCDDLSQRNEKLAALFEHKDLNAFDPDELREIAKSRPDLFRFVGWLKVPTFKVEE